MMQALPDSRLWNARLIVECPLPVVDSIGDCLATDFESSIDIPQSAINPTIANCKSGNATCTVLANLLYCVVSRQGYPERD